MHKCTSGKSLGCVRIGPNLCKIINGGCGAFMLN